jgi:sn-glycerol 3-phosphate transport system ATP-binding protein
MVFQNYALYPHMSVYDNMAYGLKNRGTPKDEIAKRVAEAAKILAIEPFLKRKPRELSGGQRQRVAMGRAIVRKPAVFLFDEPLSNLDAKLRVTMRVEIKRLQRAVGVTSVYVTHDQLEAMTLADVLVVMNHGVTEQIGTPLDIYERPATTFVAGFIGAPPMNLIGVVPDAGGRPQLGAGSSLAGADAIRLPAGGGMLGVRPEHLMLTGDDGLPEGGAGFDLAVTAVEQVGAESYVYGRLAGGPEMIVRVPGKHTPAVGEAIRAIATQEYLHVFDEGGRRAA